MFATDYRRMAREALRGKWKAAMGVMLLAQAVMLYFGLDEIYMRFFARPYYFELEGQVLQVPGYYGYMPVGIGWAILVVLLLFECASMMVTVGEYRAMAALYRDEQPTARMIFPWKLFGKALAMNLLRALLVFGWSMLFVIPGIVAIYRYSMADYLLAEKPELGPVQALRESRERMMGHKGELFCLQFSFMGWQMLSMLVGLMLGNLLVVGGVPLAGLIYTVGLWLISTPLNIYILAAETAFFRRVMDGEATRRETVYTEFAGSNVAGPDYSAEGEDETERKLEELSADESVARDLYRQHGCSRRRLAREGLLEDYEALKPAPASEALWRRDWGDELMRRFDREPEALGELLALCEEYADESLSNRVLARIDRHIRQQTLGDEAILDMLSRTMAMLTGGAFTEPGFLARRREQVADMASRLEQRLSESDPDGDWRTALQKLRESCKEP